MKFSKFIPLLLLPVALFGQTSVQKNQSTNALTNGSIVVPTGVSITASGSGAINATNIIYTTGNAILSGNNGGGFTNVTIGSGLSFAGGTLSSTGSGGTVTSFSFTNANGVTGTVTNSTTTPTLSLSLGAITPSSVSTGALTATGTTTLATSLSGLLKGTAGVVSTATSGTDYAPATSGTSLLYGNGSGGFSNVTIGTGVSFSGGTLSATGSGGTVTSFSAGTLSPLFTTSVATSTSTPALSFSLTNAAAGTIFGNNTGSAGAPAYSTISSYLDTFSSTQGSILYRNGSGWAALTPGTAGQVLATGGSAANPSWTNASAGTVTSVSGTGTVNGITLSGTVTSSGSLTLGGTLSGVSLTTQVSGTLPVANGGTGVTTSTGTGSVVLSSSPVLVTPNLGTPSYVNLSNGSALPTTALTGTVSNAQLANSAITIAGTSTSLGGSISQDTITGLSGSTSIVYHSATNTLSSVTVGSGLSFSGGTLTATATSPTSYHAQTDTGAGTVAVAPTGQIATEYITTTASSSTSRNVTVAHGSLTAGAITKIRFSNSGNGANVTTYNVYDTSTGGTLLATFQVDSTTPAAQLEMVYTGSTFQLLTTIIPASGSNP